MKTLLLLCALVVWNRAWADNVTFDFEDDTAHRTSGNNNYNNAGNTYSENGVTIKLTYADAVMSGTPLTGTANVLGRIASGTKNTPVVLIGPISISNRKVTGLSFNTKGVQTMAMNVAYSLDNSNWTALSALSMTNMPTSKTSKSVTNLDITGTYFYLRFTVSVSSSTKSNRDFQLDDIVVTHESALVGLQDPVFTPAAGSYYYGQPISIDAENSTHIYYNINSEADPSDASDEYTSPFTLTNNMTVKAVAYDASSASNVVAATYTLKAPEEPEFSVPAGGVAEGTAVEMTKGEGGSKVVYTTDGTDPTVSSPEYTSAIIIDKPMTIKAATVDAGDNLSSIASATYSIVVYNTITLWEEDFATYSAGSVPSDGTYSYVCTKGGTNTSVYDDTYAGGTSPELLVSKSNGSFQATIPLSNVEGGLTLSYMTNNNYLAITTTTTGVTVSEVNYDSDTKKAIVSITGVTNSMNSLVIKFTNTYSSNCRLDNIQLTYEKPIPTVPAIVTAAEYATFNSQNALDFSSTGITVYTAVDNVNSVTLNEITSGRVPANTPVVLYKAGGATANVPVIASADAIEGTNDLRVSTGTDVDNMYVLAMNPTIGFYRWAGVTDLSAGKVYLKGNASYSARTFIGFGEEASISDINREAATNNRYFDLQGRRVAQPTKGLYIVNGKMVVVK